MRRQFRCTEWLTCDRFECPAWDGHNHEDKPLLYCPRTNAAVMCDVVGIEQHPKTS